MYDRIIALALLFVATFLPIDMVSFVVRPEIQLLLGTLIVIYIVLKDPIAGFIAGTALLVTYFRVYAEKLGITFQQAIGINKLTSSLFSSSDSMPYITPEHLRSAQNNIVDPSNYEAEMKGVRGVYGEDVYGAQGIDKSMPGFSPALGEDVQGY